LGRSVSILELTDVRPNNGLRRIAGTAALKIGSANLQEVAC
jgi:hypothetical protein